MAAVLVGGLTVSTPAQAFEVKHSDAGELVRWRRANVAWTVDRSVREVKGGEAAVIAAVKAWSQREGAPTLAADTFDASLAPGFDGKNTVFYARDGYEPAGIALAVTVLSFDSYSGEVLDADIVLNGRYAFGPVTVDAVGAAARADATYDVGRVLAHEMGHALGLSDEPALKDALMYPYVPHSRALLAALAADDVAGLQMLYGGDAPSGAVVGNEAEDSSGTSAGCTGAVVAASGLHAPHATMWIAGGLVAAALIVARRGGRARRGSAGCAVLAAVALVAAPPSPSASPLPPEPIGYDAHAVVTNVQTTSVGGLFRSEIELSSISTGTVSQVVVWGGTIGNVRQVVGGVQVPLAGEKVGAVLASRSRERTVRTMTRIAQ